MNTKTRFNVGYAIAAIFAVFVIQYFVSTASSASHQYRAYHLFPRR